MATKLYPPLIDGVLPAFCLEYDTISGEILRGATITIPFTNNASVGPTQFEGFSLRIRTVSSGTYVLPPIFSESYDIVGSGGEVTFHLTKKQAIKFNEGQYYKIQIAYCKDKILDTEKNVSGTNIGYYSTVGIAKCTSKAQVTIKGLDHSNINAFTNEFFGVYDLELCHDRTEKVYSYEFKVYDENENLYYTSGEKLHQAYYDTDYISSIDRIILNDFASTDKIYSIQYTVTTLNGLQLSSPRYQVSSQFFVEPTGNIKIKPVSDEEHGVITIYFEGDNDPNHSYYFLLDETLLNGLLVDENDNPLPDDNQQTLVDVAKDILSRYNTDGKIEFLKSSTMYLYTRGDKKYYKFLNSNLSSKKYRFNSINETYYDIDVVRGYTDEEIIQNEEQFRASISGFSTYKKIVKGIDLIDTLTFQQVEDDFLDLNRYYRLNQTTQEKRYFGNFLLSRSSDEDNYTTWFTIARFQLDDQMPSKIVIKDVTIEHGRRYQYALQQYNVWGLYSSRILADKPYEASFEDAFLYDGEISLRIRYNPAVDSFKTTILEQKTDTIGGRYPFITRNGATYYKEFPLGGLLAQEIDDWNQFVDPRLGETHRHTTHSHSHYDDENHRYVIDGQPDTALLNPHDFSDTTIALERDFKLKVLEWLNNGKPKLFKSPYEGNYIIRLMNVSLTPVKELGRMLHSFTSQAYEIAECTYDNLVSYGFIKTDIPTDVVGLWRSYDLSDDSLIDANGDIVIEFENGGIQGFTVQDLMPGDMIYLTFADNPYEELPVMIGITGSYTYESDTKNLVKIRIPAAGLDHKLTGVINVFYEGVRITDFDAITGMQLKTIVSQQYVGYSPWMQSLKTIIDWSKNDFGVFENGILQSQYNELQNYNFRTYLDSVITPANIVDGVVTSYTPTEMFGRLAQTFDPGELLDRINLSINKGEKYKTQLLKMEMIRFRQRPVIPVYTAHNTDYGKYTPGRYLDLLTETQQQNGQEVFLVSTSPYGYPHPIEELSEFEMIDPFAIYQVMYYDNRTNPEIPTWKPIPPSTHLYPYYDPYYRTWLVDDYDPTVKMNFTWTPVVLFEHYSDINDAVASEPEVLEIQDDRLVLKEDTSEYRELVSFGFPELALDQEYLLLLPRSREIYRNSKIGKINQAKRASGKWIDQAINEEEIFDYELLYDYGEKVPNTSVTLPHYYITDGKENYKIESNKFDLYDLVGEQYLACGQTTIESNRIYWFKKYDIILNLTTEKEIEYKDITPMNSYHIGNGVIAELTFQLRVLDFYTETYDLDVARAKAAYLEAKEFYTTIMRTYNIIANADMEKKRSRAFMELYYRLIHGNKTPMSQEDINMIKATLSELVDSKELRLLTLYEVIMINSALASDIVDGLVEYKKNHLDEEDILTAFDRIEIYNYSAQTAVEDIDVNYVLDKNDFIKESAGATLVYRYKTFEENQVYFYKANKNRPASDNFSADDPTKVVIYHPANGTTPAYYEVRLKTDVESSGDDIQLLTEVKNLDLTISTYAILNDEQLATLQTEEYFLACKVVESTTLHEQSEIDRILNNKNETTSGTEEKLQIISGLVDETRNEIANIKAYADIATLDYTSKYLDMINKVSSFNDAVYNDWCARALDELLQAGYTRNQLIDMFDDIQNDAEEIFVIDPEGNLKAMLNAGIRLQKVAMDEIEKLKPNTDVQGDLEGDEQSDIAIENKIALIRGQIILKAIAIYHYCEKAFEAMTSISNRVNTTESINLLKDLVNRYSILREAIINIKDPSNNNVINGDNFKGVLKYLKNLYSRYDILYMDESNKYRNDQNYLANSEEARQNLALLCNYYEDIIFLKNYLTEPEMHIPEYEPMPDISARIKNINNVFENFAIEGLSIDQSSETYASIATFFNGISSTFINPVFNYSGSNPFREQVNALSNDDKNELQRAFETNYYFYRQSYQSRELIIQNIVIPETSTRKYKNPFTYFIFNPLGELYDFNTIQPSWSPSQNRGMSRYLKLYDVLDIRNLTSEEIDIKIRARFGDITHEFATMANSDKKVYQYYIKSNNNNDNYFIYNSLFLFSGTTKYSYARIKSELMSNKIWIINPDYENNKTDLTNLEIYNSLTPIKQEEILTLYKQLISKIVSMLGELRDGTNLSMRNQLRDTYYCLSDSEIAAIRTREDNPITDLPDSRNLFKVRQAMLKTTAGTSESDEIGTVGAMINKINDVKSKLIALIDNYNEGKTGSDRLSKVLLSPYENKNISSVQFFDLTDNQHTAKHYRIPYENNNSIVELYENWINDIYLNPDELDLITRVKENTDPAELDEKGLFWTYIKLYEQTQLPDLQKLLEEQEVLDRIYSTQLADYEEKYNDFIEDYMFNSELYNSYAGSKALEYYKALQSSNYVEADRLLKEYKDAVRKAWWVFLGLLDTRYKQEKDRGMYV